VDNASALPTFPQPQQQQSIKLNILEKSVSATLDAGPTAVVTKQPPEPVEEVPPEVKPEGNAIWAPGYWAWDDDQQDFIWVSGAWRVMPPNSQWVPGYWTQPDGGSVWVSGYWASTAQPQTQYVDPSNKDAVLSGSSAISIRGPAPGAAPGVGPG
jgi:hypothetical protein